MTDDQPTIQDVIEILKKMDNRFDAMDNRFDAMEKRLTGQIQDAKGELEVAIDNFDAKIDRFKDELKEEINGSYGLHDERIARLEDTAQAAE